MVCSSYLYHVDSLVQFLRGLYFAHFSPKTWTNLQTPDFANIIPLFFATISRSNARWHLPCSMFWVQTARNTGYITCWPLILRRTFGQIYFRRLSSLPINFTPALVCDEVGQLPDPNCAKGLPRSYPSSSSSQQVSRRPQAFPLSSLRSPLRILCRVFRSTMNDSIIVFTNPHGFKFKIKTTRSFSAYTITFARRPQFMPRNGSMIKIKTRDLDHWRGFLSPFPSFQFLWLSKPQVGSASSSY